MSKVIRIGELDVGFKLKKPCKDCPFRKNAEYHSGIFNSLVEYNDHLESRTMVHTCHKTDNRSDSEEGQAYTGQMQHCAGLLAMMVKDASLLGRYQAKALDKGEFKPEEIKDTDQVFDSFQEMVLYYAKKSGRLEGILKKAQHGKED